MLAAFVQKLTPAECQSLLAGQSGLALVPRAALIASPARAPRHVAAVSPTGIREGLCRCMTREEGMQWLVALKLTKPTLLAALQELDVHVSTRDTVASLREKLVEAEIGRRLCTEAIQTTSLAR